MKILYPGPEVSLKLFLGKCEFKLKKLKFSQLLVHLVQNIAFLKYSKTKPFATLKRPFATGGEWRMGWTTLF
jgi:hypothetical protein